MKPSEQQRRFKLEHWLEQHEKLGKRRRNRKDDTKNLKRKEPK